MLFIILTLLNLLSYLSVPLLALFLGKTYFQLLNGFLILIIGLLINNVDYFTKIPNYFFSWLPSLTGNELKVLLAIFRLTSGYRQVSGVITLEKISEVTGVAVNNLAFLINSLVNKGRLEKYHYKHTFKYAIPVNYESLSNKNTRQCYLAHTKNTCPYLLLSSVSPQCKGCPRYEINKK